MANQPQVALVMGSQSDWSTMKNTAELLDTLSISYHAQVVSAHRTPDLLFEFAQHAKTAGYRVIVAGAGGAAHLPGMLAAKTELPVIGVPIQSQALNGLDSLLSIVQMPAGVPVATVAIGPAGAKNAAILAASILALDNQDIAKALIQYRHTQTQAVLDDSDLGDQAP